MLVGALWWEFGFKFLLVSCFNSLGEFLSVLIFVALETVDLKENMN